MIQYVGEDLDGRSRYNSGLGVVSKWLLVYFHFFFFNNRTIGHGIIYIKTCLLHSAASSHEPLLWNRSRMWTWRALYRYVSVLSTCQGSRISHIKSTAPRVAPAAYTQAGVKISIVIIHLRAPTAWAVCKGISMDCRQQLSPEDSTTRPVQNSSYGPGPKTLRSGMSTLREDSKNLFHISVLTTAHTEDFRTPSRPHGPRLVPWSLR